MAKTKSLSLLIVLAFALGMVAPLAVQAEPGHSGSHDSQNGNHDLHSGEHHHDFSETTYGKPGDPTKPSRIVAIKMVEADGGMAFIPSQVQVAKGEQISFKVTNVGDLEHEIVIATAEENLKHAEMMQENPEMVHRDANALRLKPGKNGSILWRFTNAGVFEMSCLIPGHKEAGMTGSVTVK